VFDGKTALALPNGYEVILPDLAMTAYSRGATMGALIEGKARKLPQPPCLTLRVRHGGGLDPVPDPHADPQVGLR
jgi:hypothetical protein